MENHVCLENCDRGLFIIQEENMEWYNSDTNPRVDPSLEEKILDEYWQADFEYVDDELTIAKTRNFIFRKIYEEEENEVIWVEPIYQRKTTVYILLEFSY